jgi:hypothetical protein
VKSELLRNSELKNQLTELALRNCNIGRKKQPKAPQGYQGIQGTQRIQGSQGDQGTQGNQESQKTQGILGSHGTRKILEPYASQGNKGILISYNKVSRIFTTLLPILALARDFLVKATFSQPLEIENRDIDLSLFSE